MAGAYNIICKVSGETGVAEMMLFESWHVRATRFSDQSRKWNGFFFSFFYYPTLAFQGPGTNRQTQNNLEAVKRDLEDAWQSGSKQEREDS